MGNILENNTQSFSDGDQITSTNLNELLTEAEFKSTAVGSGITLDIDGKLALPSDIPTRSFTSPTLNNPTVEGTFTVNASTLGGSGIVIESEGIASNDNDTSLPTSAAVKDYVDTKITAEDLDFAGDTGTGAVDLDSQTLTIAGTANKIETSASGQTLTLTLPSTVNISTLNATTLSTTGEITAGDDIVLTNNFPVIRTDDNSEDLTLRGGLDDAGGQIKLYGSTAASANDIAYFADEHEFWNTAVTQKIAFNGNEISFGSAQDVNLYRSGADALKTDDSLEVVGEFRVNGGGTGSIVVNDEDSSLCPTMTFLRNGGGTTTNDFIKFENSGGEVGAINATGGGYFSGNIGIGTSSPSTLGGGADLAVIQSGGARIVLNNNSRNWAIKGDSGSDDLRITARGSSDTVDIDLMTLLTSGEVGIGTTSPSAKLHVYNSAATHTLLYLQQANTSYNTDINLYNANNTTSSTLISKRTTGDLWLYQSGANNVSVFTSAAERMRIDSSGNLSILGGNIGIDGNNSPQQFYGAGGNVAGTNTSGGVLTVIGHSPNAVGDLSAPPYDGSNFVGASGIMARGFSESGQYRGSLEFFTKTASAANATSRMLISHDGKVGIGTQSPAPQYTLDVNGNGRFGSTVIFNGQTQNYNGAYDIYRSGAGYVRHRIPDQSLYLGVTNTAGTVHYPILMSPINDALVFNNEEGEMARFDTSGNLGIGTTSAGDKLEVGGDITLDASNANLKIKAGAGGTTGAVYYTFNSDSTIYGRLDLPYDTRGSLGLRMKSAASYPITIDSGNGILFQEDGTTHSAFDAAGNLGIGDSTPSYKLDVNGTFRTTDDIYNNISGTQSALPGYYKGTYGAQIESTATGSTLHIARSIGNCMNIGADSNATVVYFRDTSAGATVATEVGNISITSSSTSFNTSSDYRLKENEVSITDGIDRLKQLSPYRFNFKIDPDKIVDGFFAHEVSDVVPEAIRGEKDGMKDEEYEVSPAVYEDVVHPAVEATYDEDGNELTPAVEEWTESVLVTEAVRDTRSVPDYQGIDQSKLVPLLTAALQEAVAKIEALEARVATLEG